jgi:hypothetical protein
MKSIGEAIKFMNLDLFKQKIAREREVKILISL